MQQAKITFCALFLFSAMFPALALDAGKQVTIWHNKPTIVREYTFQIISGGDEFLMQVTDGQYKKALPFAEQETIVFTFPDHFVKVAVLEFCELPPVHAMVNISLLKRRLHAGCRVTETTFLNQKAVIMENSLIYLVFLPELGARIIDMGMQADRENYLYVNRELVSSYSYSEAWQDLGGWEDNLGGWCGPL